MIKKILGYVIFSIILCFFVFTFFSRLFGVRYYIVVSDSMYPAISKNSIVYIKSIDNNYTLEIDNVVAIDTGSTPLMHRIVEINGEDITTHGDNNDEDVIEKVKRNQIIGKAFFSIPIIGILFRSIYPLLLISLVILALIVGDKLRKELKKK